MKQTVHVAVAVIQDSDNKVCLGLRHNDAHQGGLWEFPGGKVEHGELVTEALRREIREELGISITGCRAFITVFHDYGDKAVRLHVYKVTAFSGEASGMEGQEVRWVELSDLDRYEFPQANEAIIKALRLPERYLITGDFHDIDEFEQKLSAALNRGIRLVQLRLKQQTVACTQFQAVIDKAAQLCGQFDAKLMLNAASDIIDRLESPEEHVAGFHYDSRTLMALNQRPKGRLFSASCHNAEELARAEKLDADFVVLSPVEETASHPGQSAMGWSAFGEMVDRTTVPVYALGGMSEAQLDKAWSCGAQGIAAISAWW